MSIMQDSILGPMVYAMLDDIVLIYETRKGLA